MWINKMAERCDSYVSIKVPTIWKKIVKIRSLNWVVLVDKPLKPLLKRWFRELSPLKDSTPETKRGKGLELWEMSIVCAECTGMPDGRSLGYWCRRRFAFSLRQGFKFERSADRQCSDWCLATQFQRIIWHPRSISAAGELLGTFQNEQEWKLYIWNLGAARLGLAE